MEKTDFLSNQSLIRFIRVIRVLPLQKFGAL